MDYPVFLIGDGMWEINEFDGTSIFLVEGGERALLIDTGIGIGNLREFVERLTDKPYDVFLTHNHRDHVGNAPLFERVYMGEPDISTGPMVRPRTSMESRLGFAAGTRRSHPDKAYPWTQADFPAFTEADEPEVIAVEDGHVFDLGGRTLTCVLVPGHSVGSMALIDSKTRTLFAGDAVNCTIGLGIAPAGSGDPVTTVAVGLESLKRLWAMDFDRTRIFNGHSDFRAPGQPLAEDVFPAAMQALENILGGAETEKRPAPNLGHDVDVYRLGRITIRFDKEKLR